MNTCIIIEITNYITKKDIENKDILEIGSKNINGSLRKYCKHNNCKSYTGIDLSPGPDVDIIGNAIFYNFNKKFDIIICTEVLEHVLLWKNLIYKIKSLCNNNGIIILTTPGPNFPYHGYPNDYWRFTPELFNEIFKDCTILKLINNWDNPGVILIAKYNNISNPITIEAYPVIKHNYSDLIERYNEFKNCGHLFLRRVLKI